MTKIEKGMLWGVFVCAVLLGVGIFSLTRSIEKAGGIKGIAIEAGKDIKDITREIQKH